MRIEFYTRQRKNDVINFLIDVAIGEFGFYEWEDYLKNKDFTPYEKKDSLFLMVLDNNKLIGTIGLLKVDDNTLKLNSFYVNKDYRNNKIGTELYDIAINFAKNNNYKKIILCTYDKFDIASKFYNNRGFYLQRKEDNGEIWLEKVF